MPELPEVEVVRRGLETHVVGRRIDRVEVSGARTARRQPGGPAEIVARLGGRTVSGARRRGKYLWLTLDGDHTVGADCLLVHLGMSGQMLVTDAGAPPVRHLHARAGLDDGCELRFVDQRMFGGLQLSADGAELPPQIGHIALDPFDPDFDPEAVARRLRAKRSTVKRSLLDQTLVSGIGNIYADETLWRCRLHYEQPNASLSQRRAVELLSTARVVMTESLAQGGTSFDALYVDINGSSGYFSRNLAAYGRQDQPCDRCGLCGRD